MGRHITPEEYLLKRTKIESLIQDLEDEIKAFYHQAEKCPLPEKLRPAESSDIKQNAILWYPGWKDQQWAVVEEVLHPNDAFKAYMYEGSRYGLDGAFTEDYNLNERIA